jgi:hypothetical protein
VTESERGPAQRTAAAEHGEQRPSSKVASTEATPADRQAPPPPNVVAELPPVQGRASPGPVTPAAPPAEQPVSRMRPEEMQSAIDRIHEAQFGKGGQGIPMTLTVTPSGRVILTQVGQRPGPNARAKANEILGERVEIPEGTTRLNAAGEGGTHSEARGLQAAGSEAENAIQATTHYACDHCAARQQGANVTNVTGTKAEHGRITRKGWKK